MMLISYLLKSLHLFLKVSWSLMTLNTYYLCLDLSSRSLMTRESIRPAGFESCMRIGQHGAGRFTPSATFRRCEVLACCPAVSDRLESKAVNARAKRILPLELRKTISPIVRGYNGSDVDDAFLLQ
jgi:hypothetical protein